MNKNILSVRSFCMLAICILIIGIFGSLWNLSMQWNFITTGAKISSSSSIAFQILLVIFFYGFYRNTPKEIEIPKEEEAEINKLLEKYK